MSITVTIRREGETSGGRQVTIEGDGQIDTQAEARAALDAAGDGAGSSVYLVGDVQRNYAQMVGYMRLGSAFRPNRTAYASRSNAILENPVRYDRRGTDAPVQNRTAGEALTLADEGAVRTMGGLGATAQILGVQFDSLAEDTSAPFEVPASAMTAGDHQLKIRYRNPGDTADRIKIVPIRLGEVVRVAPGADGSAYGAVLNMPATARRSATATDPVRVGSVTTTSAFPANSTYQLFVDSNPVGTAQPLPADRRTDLTVPATVTDAPHQIELRVLRTGQPAIIYPAVNVTVEPAAPASGFSGADAVRMDQASYSRATMAVPYITVNATRAVDGATITVGGTPIAGFSGHLNAGENRIHLSVPSLGMRNNVNRGTAGTHAVVVTLPGGESRTTNFVVTGRATTTTTTTTTRRRERAE